MFRLKHSGAILLAALAAAPAWAAENTPAESPATMPMMQQGGTGMMMGGGMGQMGMSPQMMQMHMHSMEQRLQNIESLLQQLVDQGKPG